MLPRKTYEMVAGRSAEMAMANEALYAGESLQGSTLEPVQLLRLDARAALE